jgi:hypothetical protein
LIFGFFRPAAHLALATTRVVDPNQQKKLDQVLFGATVTHATGAGPK